MCVKVRVRVCLGESCHYNQDISGAEACFPAVRRSSVPLQILLWFSLTFLMQFALLDPALKDLTQLLLSSSFFYLVLWLCQYNQPFALLTGVDFACIWCPGHRGYLTSPHSAVHLGWCSCLSETHKHKYKAYCFSMIPPSPKHAVLLSHWGEFWGFIMCFRTRSKSSEAGAGFQQCDTLQVKRGSFKHAHACMSPVISTAVVELSHPPVASPKVLCWFSVGAAGSDCPLTWAIAEAWWVLMINTELLSCYLYKCHL